ncbi:MAG: hypothetical protein LBJ14_04255 [Desulfarculales bacterium]|jgi:hypothetical protein|nr:hypothetical protein [Desulfarculales bacterium]
MSRTQQAYILERVIKGYERFFALRPEIIKPSWEMACIYYAYAHAAEDKERADIYLQKAASICYDILLHTGISNDFLKAICYYFLTQHDWQKIEPALQNLDRSFHEGRKLLSASDWGKAHPQDKENSLWTIGWLDNIIQQDMPNSSWLSMYHATGWRRRSKPRPILSGPRIFTKRPAWRPVPVNTYLIACSALCRWSGTEIASCGVCSKSSPA